MNRICGWLVDIWSRALKPDERDVVLGDFEESGETGGLALWGLLGLVARRQTGLWKDWRPWLAMFGIVVCVGALLSEIAFRLDVAIGQQLRTYWKYGVHVNTGLTAGEDIAYLVCLSLVVLLWSWTGGFVLGSLSGRATWLTGSLFYLVAHNAFIARLLVHRQIFLVPPRLPLMILAAVLPTSISTVLFLVGAFRGMSRGLRMRPVGFRQTLLLTAAIVSLTLLVTWIGGWYETWHEVWSGGVWLGVPWQKRVLPLAMASWPIAYMLGTAVWRRWHGKAASV